VTFFNLTHAINAVHDALAAQGCELTAQQVVEAARRRSAAEVESIARSCAAAGVEPATIPALVRSLAAVLGEPGDCSEQMREQIVTLAADVRAYPERPGPDELADLFGDVDVVGATEYRALVEMVVDGTSDIRQPDERRAMAVAMLEEARRYASTMIEQLQHTTAQPAGV